METVDKQFILIIITLYIISAIINSIFFGRLELISDFTLAEVIALVGIGALFVASWFDRRTTVTRNKKIACHSIIIEIDEMERGFKHGGYDKVEYDDVSYTSAIFSTDAYDSIVQSGIFLDFSKDTQNRLKNFYLTISLRNKAIRELGMYYNAYFVDGSTRERINRWNRERKRYGSVITVYEKYIIDNFENISNTMGEELLATRRWIF